MADPRIILFNDDESVASLLKDALLIAGGLTVTSESSIKTGLNLYLSGSYNIVIINFDMGYLDAEELITQLKEADPDIVIIGFVNSIMPALRQKMVQWGVYDCISQPINDEKLLTLVKRGAELYSISAAHRKLIRGLQEQNGSLQKQNNLLANRIEESTKNLSRLYEDLRSTYLRTIKVLAQAIDARDHYTHSHSQNVARYAVAIAEELGLTAKEIQTLSDACELHDVGKIGVQDDVLIKPAALTKDEWEVMKRHPVTGAQILEPLTFLHDVIDLIRQHHEHFDGTGYPLGLKGPEIKLGARIIHIADAYEAMTSARSYRQTPLTKDEALLEIKVNSGTQFDPKLVEAFLRVADKL